MLFRLCHPHSYKQVYEYDVTTKSFKGAIGEVTTEALDFMYRGMNMILKNVTFEVQADFGVGVLDEKTHKWDGCMGRLQENQSDITMQMFKYPMDVDRLKQGLIAYETTLVIGGMYQPIRVGHLAQTLESFLSFDIHVWLLCLLFVCMVYMTIRLRINLASRLRRSRSLKRQYPLYFTLTHCARYGVMSSRGLNQKFLFLTTSIFSIVIIHYFCSMIKTQLVVIPEPSVYYSYDDVIRRNATPFFIKGMAYDQFFKSKNAPPERKKLWTYATETFGLENLYVEIDPLLLLVSAMKLIKGEGVMILDHVLMPLLPGSGCPVVMHEPAQLLRTVNLLGNPEKMTPLLETLDLDEGQKQFIKDFTRKYPMHFNSTPSFNFHTAKDPSETKFAQGIIVSGVSNEKLISSFVKTTRIGIEIGYIDKIIQRLDRYNLLRGHQMIPVLFGAVNKSRANLYEECVASTILKPEIPYHSLTLGNMHALVFVCTICFTVSIIILRLESLLVDKLTKKSVTSCFTQK